ncbi:hypothetical protein ATCC90586_001599 [Pythium insidiosum]|nr:hypothetical protein ATCC90586_001599 [Pythium insidiosum]
MPGHAAPPRAFASRSAYSLLPPTADDDDNAAGDADSGEEDRPLRTTIAAEDYTRLDAPSPMTGAPHGAFNSMTSMGAERSVPQKPWWELVRRFRVLEFSLSFAMFGIALVFAKIRVHERDFPHIAVPISPSNTFYALDPTINHKKLKEHVPMVMLVAGGVLLPILSNLFINFVLPKFKRVRMIPHDTRDFLLSLAQSAGLSQVLTQFIKNQTGRFRPCFHDMCQWNTNVTWDGVTNLCQSHKWEQEGRKSFPSGHASFAWSTLFLLTLYLLGRSRLNVENRSETTLRGARKTLKLFMCFLPTLIAIWVAVTRSIDNWHHYSDILAGSIIGGFAAAFGYSYNYGSIFCAESAGIPHQELHAKRKKHDDRVDGTELTSGSPSMSKPGAVDDFSIHVTN